MTAENAEQQLGLVALGLSDSEQAVLGLLLDLQLNPASIDANVFPMLSLASDLKVAIRSGLKGVHAMALQKLSLESLKKAERTQLIEFQEVLRQKLAEIEEVLKQN